MQMYVCNYALAYFFTLGVKFCVEVVNLSLNLCLTPGPCQKDSNLGKLITVHLTGYKKLRIKTNAEFLLWRLSII